MIVAPLHSNSVIHDLAFDVNRRELWRPPLNLIFQVFATREYIPSQIEAMLAEAEHLTNGQVRFTLTTNPDATFRFTYEPDNANFFGPDGTIWAAELTYVSQTQGLITGGRVAVADVQYARSSKIIGHGLGHLLGLGHTQDPAGKDFIMGGAPLDAQTYHAEELAAWHFMASLPAGAINPRVEAGTSSVTKRYWACHG